MKNDEFKQIYFWVILTFITNIAIFYAIQSYFS